MRKVYLHDHFGEEFGGVFELEVETAAEAIRALCVQIPEFENRFREGYFRIAREKTDGSGDLDLDQVLAFRLGEADLHIIPVIEGSLDDEQKKGAKKAIIGVVIAGVLIVATGGLAGMFGQMAIGMIVSGVSTMLSPQKKDKNGKEEGSYIANGPGNVYDQGHPVPIVYGRAMTGGVMISGGVDVEQLGN